MSPLRGARALVTTSTKAQAAVDSLVVRTEIVGDDGFHGPAATDPPRIAVDTTCQATLEWLGHAGSPASRPLGHPAQAVREKRLRGILIGVIQQDSLAKPI